MSLISIAKQTAVVAAYDGLSGQIAPIGEYVEVAGASYVSKKYIKPYVSSMAGDKLPEQLKEPVSCIASMAIALSAVDMAKGKEVNMKKRLFDGAIAYGADRVVGMYA